MSQDYTVAKELASLKEIKQSAEQRISDLSLNALNYVDDHRLHKTGGGGGGGGVLVVNDNDGTLDKTWKEISDAFDAGALVHAYRNMDGLLSKEIITMLVTNNTNMFGVAISGHLYTTNTENGYPVSGK